MFEYWQKLELFHKSIFISVIYSLLAILISCILLLANTSWIYGALFGILLMFISYFFIWILWYKIPKIKLSMAKATPWLVPLIRIILFMGFYCLIVFYINPQLEPQNIGLDRVLYPINTFSLLFTYTIPFASYLTANIIEVIFSKKVEKEVK